ncbi:MAG TPA: FHA domain-containing protein [Kofleriaceae bacterium]|nr:FHA domain-containing protein [Kofleriaceae bacterium]
MRHFYCRDVLWETFEQMANDFDCSIDYLVNEAMRYYARSKNYQSPGGPPVTQGAPAVNPSPGPGQGMNNTGGPTSYSAAPAKPGNGMRGQAGTQPPPPGGMQGMRGRAQPPTPGYQGQNNVNVSARTGSPTGVPGGMNAMAPAPAVQPAPTGASPMPMGVGGGPTLFLIYNGQRYPVTKDQFIIGRGSKTSDLPIKDGNISRKHAAVIRRNGTFYIKDLGSTNGIDYKGMRIDNKRIDEGDVFHLCDYELRFTYRAD